MTGTLLDNLRLEVLASSVAGNLITNHSAQGGTITGWTPGGDNGPLPAGASVTADSGLAWGYNGKAFKLVQGTAPEYVGITSGNIPIVGLQWMNMAATFRAPAGETERAALLRVRFFTASNVELASALGDTGVFGNFGGWVADADNVVSYDTIPESFGVDPGPRQAPSGTAYMRVEFAAGGTAADNGSPGDPTWISEIMVITASSKSLASGVVFSDEAETWQNVLPKGLRVTVTRGGDVDGVSDELDAGIMVATVRDPLLTPENNDRVRPGRPVRLRGLNGSTWESVFRGKIIQARTRYPGGEPVVTITATDAMADLENYQAALGKSGRFKQRVDSALLNVPVTYTVTDTDADVTQATISADESGTPLSQLKTIRDSLRGLFYVARDNVLKCFANNSYPSQTTTVTVSDNYADTGAVYYRDIETNFDSKNLVNTLTVVKRALSEPSGEKTYGPYINQASVDAWGSVSATLYINDGDPATLAAAYLAVYASPTISTESVTFEASEDVSKAIVRELYEAVRVKFATAGVNAVYRTIAIEHDIVADKDHLPEGGKWDVVLRFKPLESTSSIVVTNPPGGPNTGPQDLVPFTREVQTGKVNVPFSAASLGTVNVSFPKPYEVAPRVFVGAEHSSFFGAATNVTKNGFTLNLRLYTSTTSATQVAVWVAHAV